MTGLADLLADLERARGIACSLEQELAEVTRQRDELAAVNEQLRALTAAALTFTADRVAVPSGGGLTLRQPPAVDRMPRVLDGDVCACRRPDLVGLTHSRARCGEQEVTDD